MPKTNRYSTARITVRLITIKLCNYSNYSLIRINRVKKQGELIVVNDELY